MVSVKEVHAVPGKGLEGDRYFKEVGTYSARLRPDENCEITMIEIEAIEALKRDLNVELGPGGSRRNIVTRGVPLNHLVGCGFEVGDIVLRGIQLCEPCSHLEGLTKKGVQAGLIHRGGLQAQILTDGIIRVGDTILSYE